jgi:ABC-type lipoprotein release transport system permease subunit
MIFGLDIWDILGIIAIICLVVTFSMNKNAAWSSLIWGILISLVVLIVNLIIGNGFHWKLYQNILTVAVLSCVLIPILTSLLDKKNKVKQS